MYPYIMLWWSKFYMTWIGIVVSFLIFLALVLHLTKKYHQNFWKFFYRLPFFIVLTYFLWSYTNFVFDIGVFPTSGSEVAMLISPYGYKFHFAGMLLGMCIAISAFFKKIVRVENKKVRADILFFSLALAVVPLWIFLLMGDNFIGMTTAWWLGIKSLHSDSQRNKFSLVYPIGLFLSLGSLIITMIIKIIKKKRFWYGMLGFSRILVWIGIVLMMQQYSRHAVSHLGSMVFDIKQYFARILALICYLIYRKRKRS